MKLKEVKSEQLKSEKLKRKLREVKGEHLNISDETEEEIKGGKVK